MINSMPCVIRPINRLMNFESISLRIHIMADAQLMIMPVPNEFLSPWHLRVTAEQYVTLSHVEVRELFPELQMI
jgi:hypothetical protein